MKKVKILKKLPKSKTKIKKNEKFTPKSKKEDKFKENYLSYYDDIKVSSKKFDW